MAYLAQERWGWCLLVFSCCIVVIVLWKSTLSTLPSPFRGLRSASSPAPNCMKCLNEYTTLWVLSKELVIRRVYFDPRKRDGHSNAAVFLFEASRRSNSTSFTGCRVGHYTSRKFRFRVPGNYWYVHEYRGATEQLAMLDCYDIPQPRSGDSASLFYTSSTSGLEVEVLSLKPLVVPEGRKHSTATVVVCLANVHMGQRSPAEYGMIYHWLRYQKTIGVDHVHMIVEDNFVRAGGFHEAYSQQALKEGFLSIDFWPHWLNKTEIYRSQMLAYEDCLYRFQGVYEYIVYSDIDDFFVPLRSDKSIMHYLQTWCAGHTGTCRFAWYQFYPSCGWDPASVGGDGNLTAIVSYDRTKARNETKSGHQLKALVDAGVHSAMELLPGYVKTYVPSSEAYYAHLRIGSHPQGGC